MAAKMNNARIREALTAGTNVKEKGPPVADGILSVTPDTPEMVEWRRNSALDIAETSSTYLDDEDDDAGPKPHELYGKFTWKIENFSEISKRELRSNIFDVGNYKWYILVYPQGCDVCNHLSLFLCVADYDKLLPGWSHFAQFTIAVVNKDPKKSKYSDTLHRFCKKEHDWGWKKFMELSKVLDGFTVADTLVIKAQVQVILDKPSKPFRCLDPQYRRELVRVYLTNVEGICRRFCDERKGKVAWVRDEAAKYKEFWSGLSAEQQRKLLSERGEVLLKGLVKHFFNEKEVTSTLVMDALYSGCKQIEEHTRKWLEGSNAEQPLVLIRQDKNILTVCGEVMDVAEKATKDFIPAAKDDNKPNDGLTLRSGQEGDEYRRDSIERDEKRLAELGRKTVEMYVISHIFSEKLEIAYREAEALKRQDQLIAEEFELQKLEEACKQARAMAEKEKKAKKKERAKVKKEQERARKEAEEAERKREEEQKRLEAERKAKEAAEKKRQEEALALQQKQQQAARERAASAKPSPVVESGAKDRKSSAPAAMQASSQPEKQTPQQWEQQPHDKPSASAAAPATKGKPAPATAKPAPQPGAKAVPAPPVSAGTAATRPSSSEASSQDSGDESDSASSQEVGTVKQAVGQGNSSSDSDSDDQTEALREEVQALRSKVKSLERQLAERDAELFALRAQLTELQPTEIADTVKGAAKERGGSADAPATSNQNSSVHSSTASLDRELASEPTAAAQPSTGGPAVVDLTVPATAAPAAPAAAKAEVPSSAVREASKAGEPNAPAAATSGRRLPQGSGPAGLGGEPMHHAPVNTRAQPNGPQPSQRMGGAASQAAASLAHHAGQPQPSSPSLANQQATGSSAAANEGISVMRAGSAHSGAAGHMEHSTQGRGQGYAHHNINHAAANGRGRSLETSSASSLSKGSAQQFIPTTSAATSSSAATSLNQNGTLQTQTSLPDGLPSYRNAAAGVIANNPAHNMAAGILAQPAAVLPPVSPSAPQAHKQLDDNTSTPNRHPGSQFNAGARLMLGQQQGQPSQGNAQRSLPFSQMPAKQRGNMPVSAQMDSPGLDDFAHMGLIDDLLTE